MKGELVYKVKASKYLKYHQGWGVVQVVEHLPNKQGASFQSPGPPREL
jgi:hypothetical protein